MNFVDKILNMLPNLDFTDENGNTILHQAIINNDINLVNLILEKSKETNQNILNIQNNQGNTAFHLAIKNENNEIANILDNAGIDKTIKNNDGEFIENITEDEEFEVIDFKFTPTCHNNNGINFIDVLYALSNNSNNIQEKDIFLDNLLDQYINKNMKGGSYKIKNINKKRKNKIKVTKGCRYLN